MTCSVSTKEIYGGTMQYGFFVAVNFAPVFWYCLAEIFVAKSYDPYTDRV